MILHVVFYQPRKSATAEELADFVSTLETASRVIPTIRQVRVGKAVNLFEYQNRSLDLNFDYVAVFEFDDQAGLQEYLLHPAHAKLADLFWSACEKTMIVDVAALDPRLSGLSKLLVE